jgi:hypothetical protein
VLVLLLLGLVLEVVLRRLLLLQQRWQWGLLPLPKHTAAVLATCHWRFDATRKGSLSHHRKR